MKLFFQRLFLILDRQSRFQALGLLLLIMLGGMLEMAGVLLLPLMVIFLVSPDRFKEKLAEFSSPNTFSPEQFLHSFLVFLAIFFVVKSLFQSLTVYLQTRFQIRAEVKLNRRLLSSYLLSPYETQFSSSTSRRLYVMLDHVPYLFSGLLQPLFVFFSECLVFLLLSAGLFFFHPGPFLCALLLTGSTSAIFCLGFRRKISALARIKSRAGKVMSERIHQSLGGLKEIKVLGREKDFLDNFAGDSLVASRALRHLNASNNYLRFFTEVSAVLAIIVIVLVLTSGQKENFGEILGGVAFFAVAAIRLLPSLNRMLTASNNILSSRCALEEISRELELEKTCPPETSFDPVPFPSDFKNIEFRNVSYRYPNTDSDTLKNINLLIPRGTTVAITGPSGAGKTTCVDLLLGLLFPGAGRIMIDDQDFLPHLQKWNSKIGYIPQSIYLADDSILRNIAFGMPDHLIDRKAALEAIEAAQLSAFLKELPQGLDQQIGEHGIRLSGGQQQRIGIARALYHQPEILVMDEATSALDNETERSLSSVLYGLHGRKTIIVIAHRLSTIQHADRIFYFVKGSVAATGTYDELLLNCPAFASLAESGGLKS